MQTTGHRFCFRCGFVAAGGEEICPEDGSKLSNIAADPYVGKTLADKYEVLELLGRGGMSIVYKVRHLFMQRLEALKMLRTELVSDGDALQRFQQESKAVATLRHVNVVRVLDFGLLEDDVPFLTMEYLEGKDLGVVLKDGGPIAPERAVPLFAQLCDGLFHAHQRGVIHRDIKPSNIIISKDPNGNELPIIVDFGIAKLLATDGSPINKLTNTGQVFGSPLYMSPEQCLSKRADERTDIYALGCVLYQALTGVPPIQGNTPVETMMRQMQEMPRAFMFVKPDHTVPQALEICVIKALAKDPESRYLNMNEFRKAILKAGGLPVTDLPGANLDTVGGAASPGVGASATATGASKPSGSPIVKKPGDSKKRNQEVRTTGTRGFRSNSTTGSGTIDMSEDEAEALLSDPALRSLSEAQSQSGKHLKKGDPSISGAQSTIGFDDPEYQLERERNRADLASVAQRDGLFTKPFIQIAIALSIMGLIGGAALFLIPASRKTEQKAIQDVMQADDEDQRDMDESGQKKPGTGINYADPDIASTDGVSISESADKVPGQLPPPAEPLIASLPKSSVPAALAGSGAAPASSPLEFETKPLARISGKIAAVAQDATSNAAVNGLPSAWPELNDIGDWKKEEDTEGKLSSKSAGKDKHSRLFPIGLDERTATDVQTVAADLTSRLEEESKDAKIGRLKFISGIGRDKDVSVMVQTISYTNSNDDDERESFIVYFNRGGSVGVLQMVPGRNVSSEEARKFLEEKIYSSFKRQGR